jgi:NifU-like protein involved in Fe-S cluster formation
MSKNDNENIIEAREAISFKTTAVVIAAAVTVLIWGIVIGIAFQRINVLEVQYANVEKKMSDLSDTVQEGMKLRIVLQEQVKNMGEKINSTYDKVDNIERMITNHILKEDKKISQAKVNESNTN